MKKTPSKPKTIIGLVLIVGIIVTIILGGLRFKTANDELVRLEKGCDLTQSYEDSEIVDLVKATQECFDRAAPLHVSREQSAYVEGCVLFCTAVVLFGLLITKNK